MSGEILKLVQKADIYKSIIWLRYMEWSVAWQSWTIALSNKLAHGGMRTKMTNGSMQWMFKEIDNNSDCIVSIIVILTFISSISCVLWPNCRLSYVILFVGLLSRALYLDICMRWFEWETVETRCCTALCEWAGYAVIRPVVQHARRALSQYRLKNVTTHHFPMCLSQQ